MLASFLQDTMIARCDGNCSQDGWSPHTTGCGGRKRAGARLLVAFLSKSEKMAIVKLLGGLLTSVSGFGRHLDCFGFADL